jgi:hypothetical protein
MYHTERNTTRGNLTGKKISGHRSFAGTDTASWSLTSSVARTERW